jgi:ATP-dependent Clp protease, protease subunit
MNEILIYDEIGGWGVSLQAFASQLPAEGQDVSVRVSSPGGDVFAGIAMASLLRSRNATVYIDGLAASAASLLAMGGKKVVMAQGSMLMVHNPWAMVAGDQNQLSKEASVLAQIAESAAQMYAQKTGKTAEEMRALMDAETWLTADEALAMGFADSIEQGLAIAACTGVERYNYKHGAKYMDIFNRQKLTDVSARLETVEAELVEYKAELEKTAEEKAAAAARVAELEAEVAAKTAELQAAKAEAETAIEEAKAEGKQEAVGEILKANAPEAPAQFDGEGAAMSHSTRWEMLKKTDKKAATEYFNKHENKILRGE